MSAMSSRIGSSTRLEGDYIRRIALQQALSARPDVTVMVQVAEVNGRPAGKPGRTSAAFAELPCLPRLPAILTHRMPGRRREEREKNLSVNLYPSRATQSRPRKIALTIPQKLTRWRAVGLENHSDDVRRRTNRYDGSRTLRRPLSSLKTRRQVCDGQDQRSVLSFLKVEEVCMWNSTSSPPQTVTLHKNIFGENYYHLNRL